MPSDSSTAPGSEWLPFANVVALIGMVTPSVAVAAVLADVLLLATGVVELLSGRSPSAP